MSASAHVEETEEVLEMFLAPLHGLSCDKIFSRYFADSSDPELKTLPVKGGVLRFDYGKDKELWARVRYDARRKLSRSQAQSLIAYTLKQFKDGIGNKFAQEYFEQNDVCVSIDTHFQTARLEYFPSLPKLLLKSSPRLEFLSIFGRIC